MSSRKEYIDRLAERLYKWDQELDVLQEKAKEKKAALDTQWQQRQKELLERRSELKDKFDELRDSADDRFEKLKDELEERFDVVKAKYKEIKDILFD